MVTDRVVYTIFDTKDSMQTAATKILRHYPQRCRSEEIAPIEPRVALGPCCYWRVETDETLFCLRRWSRGGIAVSRLQFLQAALWHAVTEGIETLPLPLETRSRKGYVEDHGAFWELLPWIEGERKYASDAFLPASFPVYAESNDDTDIVERECAENLTVPQKVEPVQLVSALMSLGQFHEAVSTFPLPNPPVGFSSAIRHATTRFQFWTPERLATLRTVLRESEQLPQSLLELRLARAGLLFLEHVVTGLRLGRLLLSDAVNIATPLQVVFRNCSSRHLRFDEQGLCGFLDCKELGVDSVSLDVAMLLGSLSCGNPMLKEAGLKAYQKFRTLSDDEWTVYRTFDFVLPIIEGLEYLDAVFLREAPLTRNQLGEIERRLTRLNDRRHRSQKAA